MRLRMREHSLREADLVEGGTETVNRLDRQRGPSHIGREGCVLADRPRLRAAAARPLSYQKLGFCWR